MEPTEKTRFLLHDIKSTIAGLSYGVDILRDSYKKNGDLPQEILEAFERDYVKLGKFLEQLQGNNLKL